MAIAAGTYTHSSGAASAGPFTFNHIASSSTGGSILFVSVATINTVTVSSMSYNGVAMTFLNNKISAPSSTNCTTYYMYNPPSGSHTVSISVSGSTSWDAGAMDYTDSAAAGTGVDKNSTSLSSTTLTETLTPTLSGMWFYTATSGTGPDATAATNCIRRSGVSAQRDLGVFDNNTNALTGGAAFTMTQSISGEGVSVFCTFDIPVPTVAVNYVGSMLTMFQ